MVVRGPQSVVRSPSFMESTDNSLRTWRRGFPSTVSLSMTHPNSPPDDVNRDAFYATGSEEPDDDADYELEPPDPDVLSSEQRLAAERMAAAARSIDVDELMREDHRRIDLELVDEWMKDIRFQFQIKHMLWATAAVAILVAVAQYSLWASVLLAVLAAIGGMLIFLSSKEREHEAAVAERRRQQYAKRQAPTDKQPNAEPDADSEVEQSPEPPAIVSPRPTFTQQLFSVCTPKELLIASIAAVVVLALLSSLLGVAVLATCLGILALLGVVIQAIGVDMPRGVALGWWLMLVLYIVISVILAATGGS